MNPLTEKILEEIRNHGPISFKRFMECALYCPVYGYYEKEGDSIGRRGDYYTSVSVGPLFGQLLAFQFAEWLNALSAKPDGGTKFADPLYLVEAGADSGQLAHDILSWLQARTPELFNQIEYWIIEPSEPRRARQRSRLDRFSRTVRWAHIPESVGAGGTDIAPTGAWRGVLFSNELLDAMPVHRMGWDAQAHSWFEWGVGIEAGRLAWVRLAPSAAEPAHDRFSPERMRDLVPDELLNVLPHGFIVEVPAPALDWWGRAAALFNAGKLLALDYGFTDEEWFIPERAAGTLRAYRGHRVGNLLLENPGEQDITAHVNFSLLQEAGEAAGLSTELFVTQERFLAGIATRLLRDASLSSQWSPEQVRQFQTLSHPNQLGHSFRALVQSRSTSR